MKDSECEIAEMTVEERRGKEGVEVVRGGTNDKKISDRKKGRRRERRAGTVICWP